MKRFVIEQSDEEFYTSHSGISLVGLALNRFTSIPTGLAKIVPSNDLIPHADVIKSYCGLLAQAKSDFVAVEQYRSDDFFRESLGNKQVPSEGTMRQRMDLRAACLPIGDNNDNGGGAKGCNRTSPSLMRPHLAKQGHKTVQLSENNGCKANSEADFVWIWGRFLKNTRAALKQSCQQNLVTDSGPSQYQSYRAETFAADG